MGVSSSVTFLTFGNFVVIFGNFLLGLQCQWWVDWLGDEWESAGAPKVFASHGSGYGNWEVFSRTARL